MNKRLLLLAALIAWISLLAGKPTLAERPAAPDDAVSLETLFADVSRAAGIVSTRQGDDRAIGVAWGDYNGDGWVDLYLTDTDGPNRLFRNNGDGTFSPSPLSDQVALADAYSGGATFADYDNDGWADLYVVNWGANVLFRNDEGRGFIDVTEIAGVGDRGNGQSASWGDFDNDGYLDLYVANWACYPRCGRPALGDSDKLYRNNGDGSFSDVTHYLNSKVMGAGFIASFVDYDNDGDLDIYLVNDEWINPVGNALWRNDGPGCGGWCFTEVSAEANANTQVMGMGLAVFDYDNDGNFDFYFSNAGPMTLLRNQGDGRFVNVAPEAGVDLPGAAAWGAVPIDFDNDGWQDLYLAVMMMDNGKGIPANPLWRNLGDGTFELIHSGSGAGAVGPSMTVAAADYDQDGWVDLLVGDAMFGYQLLRNQGAAFFPDHHWLTIRLEGGGPVNRDAVGTRVELRTADGRFQMQEVRNGVSLGAGSELALHFGLGAPRAAELTVIWPDGRRQAFGNVPANQRVHLVYPLDRGAERAQQAALYGGAPSTGSGSMAGSGSAVWPVGLAVTAVVLLLAAAVLSWRGRQPETISQATARGVGRSLRSVASVAAILLAVGALATAGMLFFRDTADPAQESEAIPLMLPHNQPLIPISQPPVYEGRSLAELLLQAGVTLPTTIERPPEEKILLGEALFWDSLLSGNRDISCATCHHPLLATGDELSVSIGTGGVGLGLERQWDGRLRQLVPRNALPIFNLGLVEFDVMFWDGRASVTPHGFDSPANDDLPFTLENIVAVQAMFPVTSQDEMRGRRSDSRSFNFAEPNELALFDDHDFVGIWTAVMDRILAVPEYVAMFGAVYPDTPPAALGFEHAANALAAYQMATFTFLDSPWDRYLGGETDALSPLAAEGARLFYGQANCVQCHSGPLLSDLQFHNIAVPQIGPGKGNEWPLDFGRARETGDLRDMFAFRTPPLRNVAITGPWMHNGAFTSLEAAVRHHFQPLPTYDLAQLTPLMQITVPEPDVCHIAETAPSAVTPTPYLTDAEVAALLAFLDSLTSPSALDLVHTIPERVPSGLPVEDGAALRRGQPHAALPRGNN
jgi:cytochrome c peroxidase